MSFAAKYDGSCSATACQYDGRIRAGDMVAYADDEIMHGCMHEGNTNVPNMFHPTQGRVLKHVKAIWKYELEPAYKQTLYIPTGFKVRHIGQAPGPLLVIGVWAEVESDNEKVPIDFYISGTGHQLPLDVGVIYCGTAVMGNGYVWHISLAVPDE